MNPRASPGSEFKWSGHDNWQLDRSHLLLLTKLSINKVFSMTGTWNSSRKGHLQTSNESISIQVFNWIIRINGTNLCWLPILSTNGPLSTAENIKHWDCLGISLSQGSWAQASWTWGKFLPCLVKVPWCLIWWGVLCWAPAPNSVFRVRNQLEQINNHSCLALDRLNGYLEVGNSWAHVLNYLPGLMAHYQGDVNEIMREYRPTLW